MLSGSGFLFSWKKAAEKRVAELEKELAQLRSGLEAKEKDLESQRGEVEHLCLAGEQLERLEKTKASEVGRLCNLASALAGNFVLLSFVVSPVYGWSLLMNVLI